MSEFKPAERYVKFVDANYLPDEFLTDILLNLYGAEGSQDWLDRHDLDGSITAYLSKELSLTDLTDALVEHIQIHLPKDPEYSFQTYVSYWLLNEALSELASRFKISREILRLLVGSNDEVYIHPSEEQWSSANERIMPLYHFVVEHNLPGLGDEMFLAFAELGESASLVEMLNRDPVDVNLVIDRYEELCDFLDCDTEQ